MAETGQGAGGVTCPFLQTKQEALRRGRRLMALPRSQKAGSVPPLPWAEGSRDTGFGASAEPLSERDAALLS